MTEKDSKKDSMETKLQYPDRYTNLHVIMSHHCQITTTWHSGERLPNVVITHSDLVLGR